MHGLGNDYVYINCFEERLDGVDLPALARAVSDRHRGIGSDGLILIRPVSGDALAGASAGAAGHGRATADVRMEMYNADGSRGEMCGNGIRCVAKYVVDHGVVSGVADDTAEHPVADARMVRVQTDRGVLTVWAMPRDGAVERVRVDMGLPILEPRQIPVAVGDGDRCMGVVLRVGDEPYKMTCVSMGNPHAVIFVSSMESVDLEAIGPQIERHATFPNGVNVHVALVVSRGEAVMRSWERGSGLTQACGTGACAVLVAGVLEDRLGRTATIHLPGGDLSVEWAAAAGGGTGTVLMTGPAEEVYCGEWPAYESHRNNVNG